MTSPPRTLVDLLRRRAETDGAKPAYAFLDSSGQEQRLSYAALDHKARGLAASLLALGAADTRILLLYPPGLEFIGALFGCLYAGVTAVPVGPPRPHRPMPRLRAFAEAANARFVLTTAATLAGVAQGRDDPVLASLDWRDGERLIREAPSGHTLPDVRPDRLALLQFTSGSTGDPKGVMVTHAGAMANLEMIRRAFRLDHSATGVFWLPVHHDMGLVGGVLEPLYVGGTSTLLSPAAFLQRPARWLQTVTDVGATITGAPNFAFDHCVDTLTPADKASLDLRRLRICFTGSEPIRAATLSRFTETFGPCGFRESAWYPCYGLAEATLLVSGGEGPGQPVRARVDREALRDGEARLSTDGSALEFVGCGRALPGEQIRIVAPDTRLALPEGGIGEIWISGPHVGAGYWGQPDDTQKTFHAVIAPSGEGPFLRTGDLGFLLRGDLFVTGRLKDAIIVRGTNHAPSDIEETAALACQGAAIGTIAAFGYDRDGQERLGLVVEASRRAVSADVPTLVAPVRAAIADQHGLTLDALVLVKPLTLPRTSSGKMQRHLVRQAFLDGTLASLGEWRAEPLPATAPQSSARPLDRAAILAWLVDRIAEASGTRTERIDPDEPFAAAGLDSLALVTLTRQLEQVVGRVVPATLAYDHPTPRRLVAALTGGEMKADHSRPGAAARAPVDRSEAVAIVGMACRLPGADSVGAFWQLLRHGIDAVRETPPDRLDLWQRLRPGVRLDTLSIPRRGGFLDAVDAFDAEFFGISPREAAAMDPQQRLLLEVSWEALESAGLPPSQLAGSRTGVFVGISSYDYALANLGDTARMDLYAATGRALSIAANRLSYVYDLRGPSLAIDTACSSSLVAVHTACRSLIGGESDLAMVGGVNLILAPELSASFARARLMADDGRCKAFDATADGYGRSEGCAVVVLKRLTDALRDRDTVLAVIVGSAVNHDGRSNGLTAPSGPAQERVIAAALDAAGFEAQDIDVVEAHGTGTPLGDPIELRAIANALGRGRPTGRPLVVGSVKTNLGHLEAAAGLAGLVKMVLALGYGTVPAHLHFRALTPQIASSELPIDIPVRPRRWRRGPRRRIAGVSSFGFGGTNAHVVLAEAPRGTGADVGPLPAPPTGALCVFSSKTAGALIDQLRRVMAAPPGELHDWAYTTQVGRDHFRWRCAVVARTFAGLRRQIGRRLDAPPAGSMAPSGEGPVVAFVCPDAGARVAGLARHLYALDSSFRRAVDRAAASAEDDVGVPIGSVLIGEGDDRMRRQAVLQPAQVVLEYALATMWRAWGVEPAVVTGDGLGAWAAGAVSGTVTIDDALRVAAYRGRLADAARGGAPADRELDAFRAAARSVRRHPSRTPMANVVEDRPGAAGRALDDDLVFGRGSGTARLAEAIDALSGAGVTVFVELGPAGRSLAAVRRGLQQRDPSAHWLPSLGARGRDWQTVLRSLGRLYELGLGVDWRMFNEGRPRRLAPVPHYPFQRQRHWIEAPAAATTASVDRSGAALATRPAATGAPDEPSAATDVATFVAREAASLLGLDGRDLAVDVPFTRLGLDSLMAVDLAAALARRYGIDLPPVDLMRGASAAEVSARMEAHRAPAAQRSPIPAGAGAGPYPLTHGQRALWLLHELTSEEWGFNIAGAVRVTGAVDVVRLRRALATVMNRHEALTTRIRTADGSPVQEPGACHAVPLIEVDARTWETTRVDAYLCREAWRRFDLVSGPPLRVRVLRQRPVDGVPVSIVLLAIDHIVADFWSVSIVVRDLLRAYGQGATEPPRGLRYADVARWLLQTAAAPEMRAHRDYWQAQFGAGARSGGLPTDRPRPGRPTYAGSSVRRRLSSELSGRLGAMAEQQGATLFTVLLAAYQALLHRYSGDSTVLVGSVAAGRDRPELADVVGYLVNPVAMRAEFFDDPTYLDLLARTRTTVLDAIEHAAYPLHLVDVTPDARPDRRRPPLFDTMFIFQRAPAFADPGLTAIALGVPGAALEVEGLRIEACPLAGQPAQYDLTLMMAEAAGTLVASLTYSASLFDEPTVARLLGHFETLLDGIVADPTRRVSAYPLLTDEETAAMAAQNAGAVRIWPETDVRALLEAGAVVDSDRVAVVFGDRSLTHRALREGIMRLSTTLRGLGIGPGRRVGVHLPRGLELPMVLAAVLDAGAAYVPLDPTFPAARLTFMVADAGLDLIIADSAASAALPRHVPVLDLGLEHPAAGVEPIAVPCAEKPRPGDLAYILYTSGSTGRPKGIRVSRRALANFLLTMRERPGLTADDVLFAVSSPSFDISMLELLLPLVCGATVVVADEATVRDGVAMIDALDRHDVTVMQATPSTWRLLLAAGWCGRPRLKALCGGEALPTALARALSARSGELWNLYGPTEATVWATALRVQDQDLSSERAYVGLGAPIANTTLHVVDGHLQPVPFGAIGELCIGGAGLAEGYLDRPELDRQAFVWLPDTASASSAASRVYRTGDLVRRSPDGSIVFEGRRDGQVKLRGHRIELGEIEAVTERYPGVAQAVATVQALRDGTEQLVVFVVTDRTIALPRDERDVRRWLGRFVPDYMVPARIVSLDALPHTPNQKVDRRALPLVESAPGRTAPRVAPRSSLEADLVRVCADALGLAPDRIGVDDSLFDLGATSLDAMRVVMRAADAFGVQVSLRTLFDEPTLAHLAAAIEQGRERSECTRVIPQAGPDPRDDVVLDPAIAAVSRQWCPGVPARILLTGATGYLGSYLLRELLGQTQARIVCLVRSRAPADAAVRLCEGLARWGAWGSEPPELGDRVEALAGDLERPGLGLDPNLLATLEDEVDAVYHAAARVNFIQGYAAHRQANVDGTRAILRLVSARRLKPLHHVSTLAVFDTGRHEGGHHYSEAADLAQTGVPRGGYAQSKWVADRLVKLAAARGVPAAIYRPGFIAGHSRTGAWNRTDIVWGLAQACLAIGKVPELTGSFDLSPVDYVSKAIVWLSLNHAPDGRAYHLANPTRFGYRETVNLLQRLGAPVDLVPFDQWRQTLLGRALEGTADGWAGLLPLLDDPDTAAATMPAFDAGRTVADLAAAGITCPPIGPDLIATYLAALPGWTP